MRNLYLALAIIGGIVPYAFFIAHFSAEGADLLNFLSAIFATPAVSGFTADLLISSLVFWIAIIRVRRRGEAPNPLIFIALNLLVGLSCAVPAYLYAREER